MIRKINEQNSPGSREKPIGNRQQMRRTHTASARMDNRQRAQRSDG
jgi:hypothetical protein